MEIVEIIQSNKKLKELPFLVVFRTMSILKSMGPLKIEDNTDVEET